MLCAITNAENCPRSGTEVQVCPGRFAAEKPLSLQNGAEARSPKPWGSALASHSAAPKSVPVASNGREVQSGGKFSAIEIHNFSDTKEMLSNQVERDTLQIAMAKPSATAEETFPLLSSEPKQIQSPNQMAPAQMEGRASPLPGASPAQSRAGWVRSPSVASGNAGAFNLQNAPPFPSPVKQKPFLNSASSNPKAASTSPGPQSFQGGLPEDMRQNPDFLSEFRSFDGGFLSVNEFFMKNLRIFEKVYAFTASNSIDITALTNRQISALIIALYDLGTTNSQWARQVSGPSRAFLSWALPAGPSPKHPLPTRWVVPPAD